MTSGLMCDQALVAWFYLTPMRHMDGVSQCARAVAEQCRLSLTQAAAQVTEGQ